MNWFLVIKKIKENMKSNNYLSSFNSLIILKCLVVFLLFNFTTICAQDTDGDTVPDVTDLDDDNDGILDTDECVQIDAISFEDAFTVDPATTLIDPTANWQSNFDFTGTDVDFKIRTTDYVADTNGSPWWFPSKGDSFLAIESHNNIIKDGLRCLLNSPKCMGWVTISLLSMPWRIGSSYRVVKFRSWRIGALVSGLMRCL